MTQPFASKIRSTQKKIKAQKIEASGIVWIAQHGHYLLISDESYKSQSTLLTLNTHHQIIGALDFPKKTEIDDLESISIVGKHLYLLSSLSHNSKGKLKRKRSKLIRFNYNNHKLSRATSLNLYELLTDIKQSTGDPILKQFLSNAIAQKSLDIEAHSIRNGDLLLGFKSPFLDDRQTAIVKIANIDAVLDGHLRKPNAELAIAIALTDPDNGEPMRLSDMIWIGDDAYLLGVANHEGKHSRLWRYHEQTQQLEAIAKFPGLKAEGITYREDNATLTVVFDLGSGKHSKYLTLPLSDI